MPGIWLNGVDLNSRQGDNAADPTDAQDLATKNYVDSRAVATFYSVAGTLVTTSGTTEIAVGSWNASSSATMTWKAGRLYRVLCRAGVFESASTVNVATVRIRKTVNSTAALQLLFFRAAIPAGVGTNVPEPLGLFGGYVKNATGADISAVPGMTIQKVVGTGNVSLYGDTSVQCFITIEDVGLVSANAPLAAIATAIT